MATTSSKLVAAIRRSGSFTQEALARRLGVSFPTVNAWERGRSEPRPGARAQLEELAAELGIRHSTNVMVIDDDPASIEIVRSIVEEYDPAIEVHGFTSGSEGLIQCGAVGPDVLFLDILMPGIDGLEVATQLRRMGGFEDLRIVFITSSTDETLHTRAQESGDQLLLKPLTPDLVLEALGVLLDV